MNQAEFTQKLQTIIPQIEGWLKELGLEGVEKAQIPRGEYYLQFERYDPNPNGGFPLWKKACMNLNGLSDSDYIPQFEYYWEWDYYEIPLERFLVWWNTPEKESPWDEDNRVR